MNFRCAAVLAAVLLSAVVFAEADPQPVDSPDAREAADAKKTDEAFGLMNTDPAKAKRMLTEVVANAPEKYQYQYEKDGKLCVKLWDKWELATYSALPEVRKANKPVVWIRSAYPRALFWLGFMEMDEKKFTDAAAHMKQGLKLEPDQPRTWCELAVITADLGDKPEALKTYDKALASRSWMSPRSRALALRGRGVQLIDLQRLDEAEESLTESLKYEPESPTAKNELKYIAELRRRGLPGGGPSQVQTTNATGTTCAVCGKKFTQAETTGGKMKQIEGVMRFVCKDCEAKPDKKVP